MENLRGCLLMVASMFSFALEDVLVKQMAAGLPMGQVVALLGIGGVLIFGPLTRAQGHSIWSSVLLSRPILLRNLGEMIATAGFVSAIVLTTLSSASAILQATPLAVTLGAALFLKERVGWRRWGAIAVGFVGVLLIVRPGPEGFAPASLFAVVAVAGLALRDLAVRAVPRDVSSAQVSVWAFLSVIVTGVLMMLATRAAPVVPESPDLARLGAAVAFGAVGYYTLVAATRIGDISVVVPFRYSRLLFAMILGALVFGERPDAPTWIGAGLIVLAGLYTIWRETRVLPGERLARSVGTAARSSDRAAPL